MTSGGVVELLMLVAVVVLAIGAGLLLGVVLRRRARAAHGPRASDGPDGGDAADAADAIGVPGRRPAGAQGSGGRGSRPMPPPLGAPAVRRTRTSPGLGAASTAAAGGGAGASHGPAASTLAGAVTVGSSDRVCPTCRTVYQDMVYCQRDARRLVTADELAAPGRAGGLSCPRCGRSFEHGLRRCPHDAGELVPLAMYQASRLKADAEPTGVLAKVCPVCRRRFDLSSRFCGRDGHELVVVN